MNHYSTSIQLHSDEFRGDRQEFGEVDVLRRRMLLEAGAYAVGDGGVDAGAERAPVVLDEHDVVGVEPGDAGQLGRLEADDDPLDLLPPHCANHFVAKFPVSAVRFLHYKAQWLTCTVDH